MKNRENISFSCFSQREAGGDRANLEVLSLRRNKAFHRGPRLPAFLLLLVSLGLTACGVVINPCYLSPSITGQPVGQTVIPGTPALFTVAASGTPPLAYQWLQNGLPVAGATGPSYLTPVASQGDSGTVFSVTVSNPYGTLTSSPAPLSIGGTLSGKLRFVATTGSDSNSGTIDNPFRTIQHCAASVDAGWTCEVRGGTYRETITPNSGVTIAAYNFEPAVIDGADPVLHWTLYQGSIYKASVNLDLGDTNQVFVGSEMMTEARWPNGDDLFHVNWATEQAGTDLTHIVDGSLPPQNWSGAKIHLWSGSAPFSHETGDVSASTSGRLTIAVDQTGTCPYICPAAGGYYYLFGTLGALDAPREWFYDSTSGTIYFMAPGSVDPNTLDVRAKIRPYAFDLRGRSGVVIRDISIFASTILTDDGSANNTFDRITARYLSHFTALPTAPDDPQGSTFSILLTHSRDSGIILNGTGNSLQNSSLAYSAGAGIAVNGNGNTIRNNLVEFVDYVGNYNSGVNLNGDGNNIQYNTINSVARQAILVSGVTNEDIGFNNIFSTMMMSRDGGAVYICCQQVASGVRVHHNWVHDSQSLVSGVGDTNALVGIYIDNGSSGFEVDQNVIWNNQRMNFVINGISGTVPNNNLIHNNTVPDGSYGGFMLISNIADCGTTRVADNRVALDIITSHASCSVSNNNSSAPGATDMTILSPVGCNFDGCSSAGPPAFFGGGALSLCPATQPSMKTHSAHGIERPHDLFRDRALTPAFCIATK